MKTLVLLTTMLLCAAAAQADRPTEPPGQSGSQGHGNGDPGSNGNGAGNGHGDGDASADAAGDGDGHGNGNGNAGQENNAGAGPSGDQGDGDAHPDPQGDGGAQGNPQPQADEPGQTQAGPSPQSTTGQPLRDADRTADESPARSVQQDGASQASGHSAEAAAGHASGAVIGVPTGADEAVDGAPVAAPDPAIVDASEALRVQRGAAGNRLAWDVPATTAAQVQVWRLDPQGWVPIAITSGEGQAFDPAGQAQSEYRLTWSEQPLGSAGLAAVATTLSFAPAADGASHLGAGLLALLWAGAAAFATVRTTTGPRRVLETPIADDHQLMPILAGLPGIDVVALDRVVNLGLRTVGQLRRLDADAVAFWAGLPAATVRAWQETLGLLQWVALPPGAAQRLALAGHATLAQVAAASPADLMATLHGAAPEVMGPGLPADEQEVTNWVVEARQAIGMPALDRPSTVPPTATA